MTKLRADEFAKLPEALKAKFKAESDGYTLIEEDVEGLKKSKADILAEKKALSAKLAELEAFKQEVEGRTSQEEQERLIAEGNFRTLEEKLRAKLTETEQAAQAERQKLLATLKNDKLATELLKLGVLEDSVDFAVYKIGDKIELDDSTGAFAFKVKDGIGDASEFGNLVNGLKAETPRIFRAEGQPGGGANGSGNGGAPNAKTVQRNAFEQMPPTEQMSFVKAGGTITD
jgi:hypothetical protein